MMPAVRKEESAAVAVAASTTAPSILTRLRCMVSPKKPTQLRIPHHHRPQPTLAPAPAPAKDSPGRGEFERVFHYIDENGDGKISPVELRNCMRVSGEELSPEDAEDVVRWTDSDGDGLLGLDDFVRLVGGEEVGEEERRQSLREAFGAYEMEGRGCITAKSLRRTLSRLGESRTVQECSEMIRRFDLDGDGMISFEEFRAMMTG